MKQSSLQKEHRTFPGLNHTRVNFLTLLCKPDHLREFPELFIPELNGVSYIKRASKFMLKSFMRSTPGNVFPTHHFLHKIQCAY
jgi:hypothetical protein